ncbi:MAG: glycosyltransferase family 2 protein [Desulfurococcaceae archaeon]
MKHDYSFAPCEDKTEDWWDGIRKVRNRDEQVAYSQPRITVMILNYNGLRYLDACINSLLNQTYKNFEIVLIDNNSSDGSVEFIREKYPQVKIIKFDSNLGFSKAYNRAISMIDADWIVMLNNDTVVREDWLENLVKAIDDEEAIYGSKILFMDYPSLVQHAGGYLTPIGAGFEIGFLRPDGEEFNRRRMVGCVCGASLLIKKRVFEELGGFDPDYVAYFEDTDLCWRAWLFGKKVIYVPQSVVYHKYGGSWGERKSVLRVRHGQRNRLANMFKNLELKTLVPALFVSILYDFMRIINFLRAKQVAQIKAIIDGYLYILINFSKLRRKRLAIQKVRKRSDKDLLRLGLMANFLQCFLEYRRLEKLPR